MPKTPGEEHLASVLRASFLKPWVFPNLYYARGKELADTIIRFGDDVIIFSEKSKEFDHSKPLDVVWKRWKATIDGATRQILGAERKLLAPNSDLFLDDRCLHPAPSHLFGTEIKNIYRVVVIQGLSLALQRYFRSNTGSLLIASHTDGSEPEGMFGYNPFLPDGKIRLVLDDYTLPILFRYIDTIRDFLNYLKKREALLRSVSTFMCHGEEELLQQYLRSIDPDGEHGFQHMIDEFSKGDVDGVNWDYDTFTEFQSSEAMGAKQELDRPSYFVDRFIDYTYENALRPDSSADERIELVLRRLAEMSRVERRIIGKHLVEFSSLSHESSSFSRLHFFDTVLTDATEALLMFSFSLGDPMPSATEDSTFEMQVSEDLATCYAVAAFEKFPSLETILIIFFVKDPRADPPLNREGYALVRRDALSEDVSREYRERAKQLGIGRWEGDTIHWREREYGDHEENTKDEEDGGLSR